ncbi:ATP-binding protein [Thiomicrorhabdus sp. ZW0627]|uniref:ATP-binding protein n=1 Tax=Thiomicrorhabdus sp. ZW0627 TaxID=3039774 RepID=UPI002436FBCA|nr:ATP-binding protein [Thiomicrorhabdus sp. ZW0627]MDG6774614.1 ATP-binding protein [Thiomicrorhabdus sp. ZW0627]
MEKKPFITGKVVIESMRDNGFKNAAYALAEIVDNSIQAGASLVQIMTYEHVIQNQQRSGKVVEEIAVLDNGSGMTASQLHSALEFGGSEHRFDKNGMGKFGMGLPNSSISQCKRVDVWSWKSLDSINYTYLDIDEMVNGNLESIPYPDEKEFPEFISSSLQQEPLPNSGTLVVWSDLDRLQWKTSKSIKKHSELRIGRMYRKFLNEEKVVIKFRNFEVSRNNSVTQQDQHIINANDPMYLTLNLTMDDLPEPFNKEAFFEPVEEYSREYLLGNETFEVTFRSSIPKRAIWDQIRKLEKKKVGNTTFGKHAAANMGLSIVRANRELDLDPSFITWDAEKNRDIGRWFGLEISFPPGLDKVFGVLNNKQAAVNLRPMDVDADAEAEGFSSSEEYKLDLKENGNNKHIMYEVASEIKQMRKKLEDVFKAYPSGNISDQTLDGHDVSDIATEKSKERGTVNPTEFDETDPSLDGVKKTLIDAGKTEEEAEEQAKRILEKGRKFEIEIVPLSTTAFFDVTRENGFILLQINENHPFYINVLSKQKPNEKLLLELVLAAWARLEQETTSEQKRRNLETARASWGEILEDFIYDAEDVEDVEDVE